MCPANCKKAWGNPFQHLFSVKWNSVLICKVIKYSVIQQFFVSHLNSTLIISLFGIIFLHLFGYEIIFSTYKFQRFEIFLCYVEHGLTKNNSLNIPKRFCFLGLYSHTNICMCFIGVGCTLVSRVMWYRVQLWPILCSRGGLCCSISSCPTCAIALACGWTYCGNFSRSGERERNCARAGQALLFPAQSVACGPWLPAAAQNCWSSLLWLGAPTSPLEQWELVRQLWRS